MGSPEKGVMFGVRLESLTSWARRNRFVMVLGVGLLGVLAFAGAAAVVGPQWVLLGIGALAVGLIALRWPFVLLAGMLALIPGEELTTFLPGGRTLTWGLGIVVLVAWFLQYLIAGEKLRLALRPTLLTGLWLVLGLTSCLWASDQQTALARASVVAQAVVFFFIIQALLRTARRVQVLAWVAFGAAVVWSLLAITIAMTAATKRVALIPTQNPAHLAFSLGLGLVMMPYVLSSVQKSIWKALTLLGAVAVVLGIVLTGTRGAWVGLAATLGFTWVATRCRVVRLRWVLAAGGLIVVAVLGLQSAGVVSDWIIERAITLFDIERTQGGAGRLNIWTVGLELVRDNLFLGVGLGNFPIRFEDYVPVASLRDIHGIYPGRDAHSIYLSVLGELGIPGLAILFAFLWTVFHRLWAMRLKPLGSLGLSLLIFAITSGLATPVQYRKYFWAALGIATAITMLKEDKRNESVGPVAHVS